MTIQRKRYTEQQKISILEPHFQKGISISELGRINNIHPVNLYQWKRAMNSKSKSQEKNKIDVEELIKENEKLRKDKNHLTMAIGELTLDNQCLKDINAFLKKKNLEDALIEQLSLSKNKKSKKKKNTLK